MTASKTRAVPRDYATNPHAFGRKPVTGWQIPELGNSADRELAIVQHQLTLAIHLARDPKAARRMSERFGFSIQRWSDYSLGKAWFTPAAWAAAATECLLESPGS